MPLIVSNNVVLPAPFGPIRAADLARWHRQRCVIDRDHPTETNGHILDVHERNARTHPCPCKLELPPGDAPSRGPAPNVAQGPTVRNVPAS